MKHEQHDQTLIDLCENLVKDIERSLEKLDVDEIAGADVLDDPKFNGEILYEVKIKKSGVVGGESRSGIELEYSIDEFNVYNLISILCDLEYYFQNKEDESI